MTDLENPCEFVAIEGDVIIVHHGRKFFLAECWSATLRGSVKTYKRSGVSYARKISPQDQVFAIEPKYREAAQIMLSCERSDNEHVDYSTKNSLLAALEPE